MLSRTGADRAVDRLRSATTEMPSLGCAGRRLHLCRPPSRTPQFGADVRCERTRWQEPRLVARQNCERKPRLPREGRLRCSYSLVPRGSDLPSREREPSGVRDGAPGASATSHLASCCLRWTDASGATSGVIAEKLILRRGTAPTASRADSCRPAAGSYRHGASDYLTLRAERDRSQRPCAPVEIVADYLRLAGRSGHPHRKPILHAGCAHLSDGVVLAAVRAGVQRAFRVSRLMDQPLWVEPLQRKGRSWIGRAVDDVNDLLLRRAVGSRGPGF